MRSRPNDETYIIRLCDEVLGAQASRRHRFDFLRSDKGKHGRTVPLPVDAYYVSHGLVVEYHERQHSEDVPFFNKRITAQGISRQLQRRIYDERRAEVLPAHGLRLEVISFHEFECASSKRLKRVPADVDVIRARLASYLP